MTCVLSRVRGNLSGSVPRAKKHTLCALPITQDGAAGRIARSQHLWKRQADESISGIPESLSWESDLSQGHTEAVRGWAMLADRPISNHEGWA